jgi:hypothetical protein
MLVGGEQQAYQEVEAGEDPEDERNVHSYILEGPKSACQGQ